MWSRLARHCGRLNSATLRRNAVDFCCLKSTSLTRHWTIQRANFGTEYLSSRNTSNLRNNRSPILKINLQNQQNASFMTNSRQNGILDFWKSPEKPPATSEKFFDIRDESDITIDRDLTSQPIDLSDGLSTSEDLLTTVGDGTIDTAISNSDVIMNFADYGLGGGILPHKLFQDILNYLTTTMDLDWIPAIAIMTLCLRVMTLPGMISMRRFSARSHNLFPESMRKMADIQRAAQSGNQFLYKKANLDYMTHLSQNKLNPVRALLINLPNGIIFMSMFMGIRQMCVAKLPSLTTGGALWFQNLTIPDPYFLLPVCACLSMSMIIRSGGAEAEMGAMATMEGFRKVLMWMPVVSLPFFVFQPSAMFAFWIVSNSFTFTTMLLFRNKAVLKFCGIPERVQHSKALTSEMSKAMNPIEMFKKMKTGQSERQELAKKVKDYQDVIKKMQDLEQKRKK